MGDEEEEQGQEGQDKTGALQHHAKPEKKHSFKKSFPAEDEILLTNLCSCSKVNWQELQTIPANQVQHFLPFTKHYEQTDFKCNFSDIVPHLITYTSVDQQRPKPWGHRCLKLKHVSDKNKWVTTPSKLLENP